jgi:hypothetical protein
MTQRELDVEHEKRESSGHGDGEGDSILRTKRRSQEETQFVVTFVIEG